MAKSKAQKKCLPNEVLERLMKMAKDKGDSEALEHLRNIKTCRKPSEYNLFIGQCMKGGKDMQTCAAEYKKSK